MTKKFHEMLHWAKYLKFVNRFTLSDDQWGFVSAALQFILQTPHEMLPTQQLYRARKHTAQQTKPYTLKNMGAPPVALHKSGRCTPAGIPCLYLSDQPETAIAEMRPWKSALITVASFKLKRKIRLADLRDSGHRSDLFKRATKAEEPRKETTLGKAALLLVLTESFSRPAQEEYDVDYAPTQFLAGAFKAHGLDGVLYSSLLRASGLNIALFDPSIAKATDSSVYVIEDVNYWSAKYGTKQSGQGT